MSHETVGWNESFDENARGWTWGAGVHAEAESDALATAERRRARPAAPGVEPRAGFAPAAEVARAVGELTLEAAAHDAGGATYGAVAGCADGLGRAVALALGRLVLDAIPRPLAAGEAPHDAGPRRREALPADRPRLPDAGWWARDGVEALTAAEPWPAVPWAADRPTPTPRRPAPAGDPALEERARRVLEREVEPASRRLAGGAR